MGSKPKQQAPVQAAPAAATPPPAVNLQTTGYGNMGYQLPQNPLGMGSAQTGQGLAPPPWAQGNWAMPWWGQQAPEVGQAMRQQQDPAAYQAQWAQQQAMATPPAAPSPQAPGMATDEQRRRMLAMMGQGIPLRGTRMSDATPEQQAQFRQAQMAQYGTPMYPQSPAGEGMGALQNALMAQHAYRQQGQPPRIDRSQFFGEGYGAGGPQATPNNVYERLAALRAMGAGGAGG